MKARLLALRQRRGELLERISAQREQAVSLGSRLQGPFAMVEGGLSALRYLRARPLLVAGIVALLVWRRRGVMGVLRTGLLAWKGMGYLSALRERVSARGF